MKINSGFWVRDVFVALLTLAALAGLEGSNAQTWSTNSPLNVARWAHTATRLNDGTVLIAGGVIYNVSGNFANTNACELYDPASGTSSLINFMQDYRNSHQATLMTNGQVLVSGGGGDASSEVYDPSSATWLNFGSMSDERLAHVAVLLPNGLVLAAAGYDDSSGAELSSAELYDPVGGTWANTGAMPYAADTLAAVLLTNGTVLVCGGSTNGSSVTNAAIYHPGSGTWTRTAGMKEARQGHAATLLPNGKVLVAGGTFDNSAEIYDPVAGTWSLVASTLDARGQSDAVLLNNGQVMLLSGGDPNVELYAPAGNTWSYTDALPVPGHSQAVTLLASGQVLVTGGSVSDYNGPPLAAVQVYGSAAPIPTLTVTNAPTSGVVPLLVQFSSPSVDSLGRTVTNWSWSFGDGAISTNQNPAHTYTNAGAFSPALSAYDSSGGSAVAVLGLRSVTVTNDSVSVTAAPTVGPVPLTVQFASPAVDGLGYTITNWNWNFGDGATNAAQSPSHAYLTLGTFTPTLVARSTHGTTPLAVNGLPSITVTNTPNPAFHVVYSFPTNQSPNGGLVLANNVLYGTTTYGGAVFALKTDGSAFTNLCSGLGRPAGSLVLGGARLFGTTYLGGSGGGGTVFAIATNGIGFTNLYNFPLGGASIGEEPAAGLCLVSNLLFGTTQYGGAWTDGAVFALATNGASIADVYSFSPASGDRINSDGDGPLARVIFGGGVLYGTTEAGGTAGDGVVFSLTTNIPGTLTPLHYFSSTGSSGTNSDGGFPFAGLVLAGNTLYGTAAFGGITGNGTVFAVHTDGSGFTNLYSFTGGSDGAAPEGDLILSGNTLYGTAAAGGTAGQGVLFAINTNGAGFTNLYSFTGGGDGAVPKGALTLSSNILYGSTTQGGLGPNAGTVFSFALPSPAPLLNIQRSGTNVLLAWSSALSGYALQSSSQLGKTAVWNPVLPSPVVLKGLNTVTNPITGSRAFYRLSQ